MNPQLAPILADLDRIADLFDLTRDGLGEDLCKAATNGVQDTIAREEAPDGTPWEQLDPEYEAWKTKHYPGKAIAFLEGLMADADEIAGELDVKPDEATVTYGKSEEARTEAVWFQEGSHENNQPPRPFFDLTKESEEAIAAILGKRFDTIQ